MIKKTNIWKIIWILGVYSILTTILYLVVLYKVKWEDKDFNTYLYFYSCNDNLCTSTIAQNKYFSRVTCVDNICPYITDIIDKNVILKQDNISWLYNYASGQVVNDKYNEYRFLNNDYFVFVDDDLKQGIINSNGEILVESKFEYIDDFNDNLIVYRSNNLYGIDSLDKTVVVDAIYSSIVLINDKIYAGMKDNEYYIYDFNNYEHYISQKYDYVNSFGDIIFVIYNNKIDILNTNLESTLLMKLNTFYEYKTEKERDSLKIRFDGDFVYFNVVTNQNEFTSYRYHVASKKFV